MDVDIKKIRYEDMIPVVLVTNSNLIIIGRIQKYEVTRYQTGLTFGKTIDCGERVSVLAPCVIYQDTDGIEVGRYLKGISKDIFVKIPVHTILSFSTPTPQIVEAWDDQWLKEFTYYTDMELFNDLYGCADSGYETPPILADEYFNTESDED